MNDSSRGRIIFEFASVERGKEILAARDEFIKNISSLECLLRMTGGERDGETAEMEGADRETIERNFLLFLQSCVLPWEEAEIQELRTPLANVREKLAGLKITLEEPVMLIKTDGREEWNSAYTRSGAIILPRKRIAEYSGAGLEELLIHEVFHVISKTYPGLRNILYGLVGFEKINDIVLPERMASLILTNPDFPYLNYYTAVYHQERKIAVMPVALIKKGRKNIDSGRDILQSITARLLVLEKRGAELRAAGEDGEPLLLDFGDVQGFKEKTGFAGEGFFSPEEAAAEAFTEVICGRAIPQQRLLRGMKKVLFS